VAGDQLVQAAAIGGWWARVQVSAAQDMVWPANVVVAGRSGR